MLATVVPPACQYPISAVTEVRMAIQQELEVVFVEDAADQRIGIYLDVILVMRCDALHGDSCPHVSTMLTCDVWSVAAGHSRFLNNQEDN